MMKLYGGIDLHSNNTMIAIVEESDRVVYQKRLPNDLDTILKRLAPYQSELEGLGVESTYNWYWLVDGLMDAGFTVHLANTAAIKQYEGTNIRMMARMAVYWHIYCV
jgi:transposase